MNAGPDTASLLADAQRRAALARSPLVERLALAGPFPAERFTDEPDLPEVVQLLCEPVRTTSGAPEFLLGETARIEALTRMLRRGGRPVLRAVRDTLRDPTPGPMQRMLDAVVREEEHPLAERSEDELVASLTVGRWLTEAIALAGLSRAMELRPTREEIEGRLAVLELTRAVRRLVAGGVVGRDEELATLHAYRSASGQDDRRGLSADPALVVHGIGGVGKSTLIAQFVVELVELSADRPTAWAYLDLDRPTLASFDAWVLLREVITQVGVQFPDDLRAFRYQQTLGDLRSVGSGLESVDTAASYRSAAFEFAAALQRVGDGTLVVVLDTVEQVERQPWHVVDKLYELFAILASALPRFKLIVSGRAPAQAFTDPSRPDRLLAVRPFTGDAAAELLTHLVRQEAERTAAPVPVLDGRLGREIADVVGGIPLTLRLAARVLVDGGPGAVTDAVRRAATLDQVREEFVRGFLYQRILDQIPDWREGSGALLREVARASLVLRRVTPELIDAVVLPAIGRAPGPDPSGGALLEALAGVGGLAEPVGDELRLREDLRGPALAALRYRDGELIGRMHRRALAYYTDVRPDPVERAYHLLAVETPGTAIPQLDDAVLRKLEPSLDELPAGVAEEIRAGLRAGTDLTVERQLVRWERGILPEVDDALLAGDLDRASALLAQRPERSRFTPLHRLESRLHEARGDLGAAIDSAVRDLEIASAAGDTARCGAAAIRLAALEEQQGRATAAIATLTGTERSELLVGSPEIRLEVLLNRLNTGERRHADDDDARWSLELDARTLLQRVEEGTGDLSTVLVRLLAAALGRHDRRRLREAAGVVGLGHDEDPARVATLVRAIADWDAAQLPPGRLAQACEVTADPPDPYGLRTLWSSVLVGTGTEGGILLQRLWSLQRPPDVVREALRALYLWWKIPADHAEAASPGPVPSFLLSGEELDFAGPEVSALEAALRAAYPTVTEILRIADRTGLDIGALNLSSSGTRQVRELLRRASRSGVVGELVRAVLEDSAASSVHAQLADLVGEAWLQDNKISRPGPATSPTTE